MQDTTLGRAMKAATFMGGLASVATLGMLVVSAWHGEVYPRGSFLHINVNNCLLLFLASLILTLILREAGRKGPKNWGRLLGRIILLAISIGLSIITCELALRVYVHRLQSGGLAELKKLKESGKPIRVHGTHALALIIQPAADPRMAYELQPNLDRMFGTHRLRTNRAGMRSLRDYDPKPPSNCTRIIGLGDSGMFGWDCNDDQNYMCVLERLLKERRDGRLYEVLNFGTPGFNTDQEVALLKQKGLAYKPDIVVVGWCENDFFLPMFVAQKDTFTRHESRLISFLFHRADFWEKAVGVKIVNRRKGEVDFDKITDEINAGTDVSGVTRALRELKELGEKNHFKILIFGPLRQNILDICRQIDLPYYNTWDKIPDGLHPKEWDIHKIHPLPEGHRVLGEYLAQELNDRGWLNPEK